MRALARLAGSGWGGAWRGDAVGAGERRARE
jgi:hypothetical protein